MRYGHAASEHASGQEPRDQIYVLMSCTCVSLITSFFASAFLVVMSHSECVGEERILNVNQRSEQGEQSVDAGLTAIGRLGVKGQD